MNKLISRLTRRISRVIQKWFKYFNGRGISTSKGFSCYFCLKFKWFRTSNVIISIIAVVLRYASWYFWIIITVIDYAIKLLNTIRLCIGFTTSRPFALSICVLSIFQMQSINGAQFESCLHIPLEFISCCWICFWFGNCHYLFHSMHASLWSQIFDFRNLVLNLIWIFLLHFLF